MKNAFSAAPPAPENCVAENFPQPAIIEIEVKKGPVALAAGPCYFWRRASSARLF